MPVEIDNQYHNVYVLKRPGVDEFMRKMGEKYEIVVFTASLSKVSDGSFHMRVLLSHVPCSMPIRF